MIKAYPAENSIIIKTYAKPYNMEILFDQIWSLPSQFFSQVFEIIISQLGSRRPIRTLTLGTELETKISLNPDEGSYLGSILDQLEGIIENPKNIKHMASQIPKTIERVHDDLKENHPRATAIVLQVINTFPGPYSKQSATDCPLCPCSNKFPNREQAILLQQEIRKLVMIAMQPRFFSCHHFRRMPRELTTFLNFFTKIPKARYIYSKYNIIYESYIGVTH